MRKFYLFILSSFVAGCLFGQDTKTTQQLTLPLYTKNPTDDISSPLIPVQKGTQFSLQANFIVPTKKPFIVKLLKGVGIGVATYQSERVIEQKSGKYGAAGNNTNWLLPTGIGITVSADKLIPKKSEKTYIQYLLYDRNMQLITENIVPVKKTNEPIIITGEAPIDGYLKVQFINTVKNDVTNGSIDINITSPSRTTMVGEVKNLKADIIETDKPNLSITIPAIIAPSIKTDDELGLIAKKILNTKKQNAITTTYNKKENTVTTITPEENKIIAVPIFGDELKNRFFTSLAERSPLRKSIPIQAPLPPIEAILPKRRIDLPKIPIEGDSDPNPDEGKEKTLSEQEDGCDPTDPDGDCYDPCAGFGGGEEQMMSTNDDCGGSGGDGDGWGDDPDDPDPCETDPTSCEPCDETDPASECYCNENDPNSACYDVCASDPEGMECYCIENPVAEECCNANDPNSACYIPCPTDNGDNNSNTNKISVDPKSFAHFLDGHVPSDATDVTLYLSSSTDANGNIIYKLSGAFSEPDGSITVFSPFTIGTLPSYDNLFYDFYFNQSSSYSPYGSSIQFNGGSVQNYFDGLHFYAIFTDATGKATIFPGVEITNPTFGGSNGYTIDGNIVVPSSFDLALLEHEYGHFLQSQIFGNNYFDFFIAPISAWNMKFSPNSHDSFWTETGANSLSNIFFGSNSVIANNPNGRFPTGNCN